MTPFDKTILKDLLPPNPIVLDIGCYDGKDGLEILDMFPGGELYAFDPIAKDVFKGHGRENVFFYSCAIGKLDGRLIFYPSSHVQSGSVKPPKNHKSVWPNISFRKCIDVPCYRLDYFFTIGQKKPRIDFIWCDLNGSEGDFIDGAAETLKGTRYLYIEFSDKELYEGQITRKELEAKLPGWKVLGEYNVGENFGNLFLKNELFNG